MNSCRCFAARTRDETLSCESVDRPWIFVTLRTCARCLWSWVVYKRALR